MSNIASLPTSRREFLERSAMGLGALGLAGVIADNDLRAADGTTARKSPHYPGRVKRVVHFFCNGGPSHVDTFDPKPMLDKYAGQPAPVTLTTERKTGGALPSAFKFAKHGESSLDISELFAKTAQHA
ncbi:MAG TPA: DUF1501 domain-containing protein, partial [Planctomycetaceae bacterium]|nr:DUF1501 domain-containing protein [Planctomycetaceae bacterium]